jgi:HPt (histidine-containing phosphotransfer) domain-containing protein
MELEAIKKEFEEGPSKTTLIDKVHRLKGGAGFLGYLSLEDLARRLDRALKNSEPYEILLADLLAELSNLLRSREGGDL